MSMRLTPIGSRGRGRGQVLLSFGLSLAATALLAGVTVLSLGASPGDADGRSTLPEGTLVVTDDADDADDDEVGSDSEPTSVREHETFELSISRDPFEEVVPEPEPEPDPTDPDPSDPDDPDPSDPDDPSDPSDPDDPDDPDDGDVRPIDPDDPDALCTDGHQEIVCEGMVVSLMGVEEVAGEPTALIRVDSTTYAVAEGERFAGAFEVLGFRDGCVELSYREEAIGLLCPGAGTLK